MRPDFSDISYASTVNSKVGRVIIRGLENVTGRAGLIRRANGYADEVVRGGDYWDVISMRYGVVPNIFAGSLNNIPRQGPVIIVSNHPFGILDGLMMGRILSERRGADFKILAHHIFHQSSDLKNAILPISFDRTKAATKANLQTRETAVNYLKNGGAIGIFPGGTVSTSRRFNAPPMDPIWRNFTAKLIAKTDATVVPVFYCGANSTLFQIVSQIHATLRLGLLIREFKRRVDLPVDMVIGEAIKPADLARFKGDAKACMDFLRKATYELSPSGIDTNMLGREFE